MWYLCVVFYCRGKLMSTNMQRWGQTPPRSEGYWSALLHEGEIHRIKPRKEPEIIEDITSDEIVDEMQPPSNTQSNVVLEGLVRY